MTGSVPLFELPEFPPAEADVLLVTATDVERQMVTDVWRGMFPSADSPRLIAGSSYAYLGALKGNHVFLVQQTRMGAIGDGQARETVEHGILDWAPAVVIMVG